ncbi:hypothetical protein BBP00_00003888 [Phytophthora kernoviae]|uniref:Peroxisomal membrane protein PEX16 n=1 Tax=Phytophthora kernoviae TaxID=325452 RepID=A0A3F2RT75_9STRA|nr:hypothetical protein BBP00_00003888 [Phytophthora kernoviae]
MVSASTVGATTDVCALSDQVKKYRARVVHDAQQSDHGAKNAVSSTAIPSLLLMCLKIISDRFRLQPKAQNVPRQFLPEVMARLPLDLDVCVTAPCVTDENYWKRCCLSKTQWKNIQITDHGLTWKQLFLEKHLQDLLEDFDPSIDDHDHLMAVVKASSEFIFTLELDQLLSHLDMNEVCAQLRNLTRLRLTYGVKQIGMKYERMLFGMKISDSTNLSHVIKMSTSLTALWLPSNLVDDDLLRMLMTGLVKNTSITSLDLSHNKLTNHGARLLSKLLGPESVITTLKLCDNQIHAEGGRYLSRGLKYNTSLVELDLRLNRLTDDGGRMLLEGLVEHSSLTNLNLSSNMLGKDSAEALAEILSDALTPLQSIDLSSNALNESDGEMLLQGLQQNSAVIALDLRQNTQIPADAACLVQIAQKIRQNEVNMKAPSTPAEGNILFTTIRMYAREQKLFLHHFCHATEAHDVNTNGRREEGDDAGDGRGCGRIYDHQNHHEDHQNHHELRSSRSGTSRISYSPVVVKRVMEPEVATQFGYSLVGLLHMYHDYVLYKKSATEKEPQTPGQRLTQFVRVPLSLISHVQVLAEVVARKVGGDVGKWRLIVWVEVVKSALRLLLLAQQRRAMLLRGGKYKGMESAPRPSPFARFKKAKQPGARTGKTFGKATMSEPAPSVETSTEDDINKITFENATIEVAEDAREDLLMAGEVCHILRPVVYAVLRRRRLETSWTPVVVSLLVELSGLALSAAAVKPATPKTPVSIDKTKDELSARKMALLLYLLRDPVFATVTKPATGKVANVLDHVPGVGKLFRFGTTAVMDYYHQFHFYTCHINIANFAGASLRHLEGKLLVVPRKPCFRLSTDERYEGDSDADSGDDSREIVGVGSAEDSEELDVASDNHEGKDQNSDKTAAVDSVESGEKREVGYHEANEADSDDVSNDRETADESEDSDEDCGVGYHEANEADSDDVSNDRETADESEGSDEDCGVGYHEANEADSDDVSNDRETADESEDSDEDCGVGYHEANEADSDDVSNDRETADESNDYHDTIDEGRYQS